MDSIPIRTPNRLTSLGIVLLTGLSLIPATVSGQVRTKKPDRGVYTPPRLDSEAGKRPRMPAPGASRDSVDSEIGDLLRQRQPRQTSVATEVRQVSHTAPRQRRELVDVALESPFPEDREQVDRIPDRDLSMADPSEPKLQPVGHEDVVLIEPQSPGSIGHNLGQGEVWMEDPVVWNDGNVIHDGTCDGCPTCDVGYCDSIGCDSIGCCNAPWYRSWSNSAICFDRDRWFGGIELLLMFGKGDRLPPLVTTGPDTDPDTAGELGQQDTQVLVGVDSILKDVRAGGRLTLGTWLDHQQCRSLVMRGWFAGEETYGYNASQDTVPVIARPFLNVSDNQAAEQDTQLIAFPGRATGSIRVHASTDVFGGDISARQFWYGKYGGTVDLLYGYQYMRLNGDLNISSTSTSLDDDFAPVGSVISIFDGFDTSNEFHGGQLGMASRYREGCWSFHSLVKVAFGSLRRTAELTGSTFTSIDGANAVDPNGLLVRSTNSGKVTDHTFGWVPELDLSLGWHQYPRFDVTVGYHVIAMTDALQVSGAIDPDLAVNLADPPTGQQRPAAALRYETYYVQGIHFGLQYVY